MSRFCRLVAILSLLGGILCACSFGQVVTPTVTMMPTVTAALSPTPSFTARPVYRTISWKELNDFLASDHTNWNKYIPGKYECVNFAIDLVENAKRQNIDSEIVAVYFANGEGHSFVAFNTVDKGIVWIEPQSDYAYNTVEVGKALCLKVDTSACNDFGVVTQIIQPVECDGITKTCWQVDSSNFLSTVQPTRVPLQPTKAPAEPTQVPAEPTKASSSGGQGSSSSSGGVPVTITNNGSHYVKVVGKGPQTYTVNVEPKQTLMVYWVPGYYAFDVYLDGVYNGSISGDVNEEHGLLTIN